MPDRRRALCGLLPAAVAIASLPGSGSAQISPQFLRENSADLEAGEVIIELQRGGPVTHVETAIVIDAPAETIWNILVACEIAPEYVPNVVDCRSLEVINNGASELFIQTVKPAFFIPSFEHVFRMDYEPYERIVISRASGPIRQLDSVWELLERDDGRVLLTYSLDVDPGIPIPRLFVRQTLRRDLPRVLYAVRERAQAADRAP